MATPVDVVATVGGLVDGDGLAALLALAALWVCPRTAGEAGVVMVDVNTGNCFPSGCWG